MNLNICLLRCQVDGLCVQIKNGIEGACDALAHICLTVQDDGRQTGYGP